MVDGDLDHARAAGVGVRAAEQQGHRTAALEFGGSDPAGVRRHAVADGVENWLLLSAIREDLGGSRSRVIVGDDRAEAGLGVGAQFGGVNEIRIRAARLGQHPKQFAAEGQAGCGGGEDLKTVSPREAAGA